MSGEAGIERARGAFLRACRLDIAIRKPGNVSLQSSGHRMQAQMFLDSARAAAEPLFTPGLGVGQRIEGAMRATWAVAGCNTNLGILLLCAPLAVAVERYPSLALAHAVEAVLAGLDLDDAAAAFRAIVLASPGGLGSAEAQDVHEAPSIDLRAAMVLAAERDLIARQYRDGYADLFAQADRLAGTALNAEAPDGPTIAAVQRLFLELLAAAPDSHIVRKHGTAVAQTVMTAAQPWRDRMRAGEALDADPAFSAWDESLKSQGINPGTTADLTVASLMLAGLIKA